MYNLLGLKNYYGLKIWIQNFVLVFCREMVVCCVVGCGRKYKRKDKDNNPKFYSISIANLYDPLTQLRRNEWLKWLNLSESSVTPKIKVCCAYFESGKTYF
jgi:hypothetical protein